MMFMSNTKLILNLSSYETSTVILRESIRNSRVDETTFVCGLEPWRNESISILSRVHNQTPYIFPNSPTKMGHKHNASTVKTFTVKGSSYSYWVFILGFCHIYLPIIFLKKKRITVLKFFISFKESNKLSFQLTNTFHTLMLQEQHIQS